MKAVVVHICFLFCSLFVWGQKASVKLLVEPQEVSVNQQFSITLKSNVDGNIVENWPSNFERGYGVQSMSRYVQDYSNGKMVQEHLVIFTGEFTKAGSYKIGPFYVKAGNKTYTSNSVMVTVGGASNNSNGGEITKKQLNQPAFGVIEVSATKLYEGEPLVVSGRVYAREETFGRPILKRPFNFNGVSDMHELQQTEMWEPKVVRNREYLSFSFGKQVLFPVGSGRLDIQSFEIFLPFFDQNYNVVSSTPSVEIIPLPSNPPANFCGGVGEFSVEQKIVNPQNVKQGDIVQIEVTVNGKGNLHAIESPVLQLPKGMNIYGDAETKDDFSFTSQGSTGKKTYTYHVQVTQEGKQVIEPVAIAYFNPKTEKYATASAAKSITVDVLVNKAFSLQTENTATPQPVNEFDKKYNYSKLKSVLTSSNSWLWYGAGSLLLLAGLLFIFYPRKKKVVAPTFEITPTIQIETTSATEVQEQIARLEFYAKEQAHDLFYAALEKTLLMVLNFHLQIDKNNQLSRNELLSALRNKQPEKAIQIQRLFEKSDVSRYGMGFNAEEMESVVQEVKGIA
ncbi:MAG: BatD family protein [Crocinitomicaceae bacterium]